MKQLQKSRTADLLQMWCEDCRIRIAPYEDFVTHNKRTLHQLCFQKAKRRALKPIVRSTDLDAATA